MTKPHQHNPRTVTPNPRAYLLTLLLMLSFVACQSISNHVMDGKTISQKLLSQPLNQFEGCFLLYDLKEGSLLKIGGKQCNTMYPACSTFKIVKAMIGLEEGIVRGPDALMVWDGSQQPSETWERDHTLESAFSESVDWYFQRLTKFIGQKRLREFLADLDYGNQSLKSLAITPAQQLRFMTDLYENRLPFDDSVQATVRGFMQKELGRTVFGGNTGSCAANKHTKIGWFVGHVTTSDRERVFVTLIKGQNAHGDQAQTISKNILHQLGIVQTPAVQLADRASTYY